MLRRRDGPATCRIGDLGQTDIELLPGGTVPAPGGEISQVVIRFNEQGEGELPIFHAAGQLPKMKLGVEYEAVDRDAGDQQATLKRDETEAPDGEDESLPAYLAPRHLTLEANIRVPSRNLYRSQIEKILKWFLFNCDLFDESMVPSLTVADPAPAMMLTPFVYNVNHFLSKETMARVEKQLRLFRD